MDLPELFPTVLRFFDVGGVLVSGVLGGMVAREKHFDIIGFIVLAVLAALGGGMVRDVLLQQGPPIALTDPYYLGAALTGALVAFALKLTGKWWNRFFIVADAFVIGAWSATGALKTLAAGLDILPAVMLGVITAVGGGAIRDIAVGRIPAIFGGNTLYATAALAATIPAITFWKLGIPTVATLSATILGAGICIAARWYRWQLPVHTSYPLADAYGKVRMTFADYVRAREKKVNDDARKATREAKLAAQEAMDAAREATAAAESQTNPHPQTLRNRSRKIKRENGSN